MFLLDTCVLSEARRRTPAAVAWLAGSDPSKQYVSAISIGEFAKGIALRSRKDPIAAASLSNWLDNLRQQFIERILPIDETIAIAWGQMMAARTLPIADALIAATARTHSLVLVTRNVADFAGTGVEIVNPWVNA